MFASWELNDQRVELFSQRKDFALGDPERTIEIPADFGALLKSDPDAAKREVLRVREEFAQTLDEGFVCRAFDRESSRPRYLFYRD